MRNTVGRLRELIGGHRTPFTLLAALCAVGIACSCGGGGTDTPLSPSDVPAGLDTSVAAMKDGAGNSGPMHVRLQSVRPGLGSQVSSNNNGSCSHSSPYDCFELLAEFCMDPVSNPNGSTLLNTMQVGAVFSSDGVTPILMNGIPMEVGEPGNTVARGDCFTMSTPTDNKPPYPSGGVPRYLVLFAAYGPTGPLNFGQAACPTPQTIAAGSSSARPVCMFRRVYDLGYHF